MPNKAPHKVSPLEHSTRLTVRVTERPYPEVPGVKHDFVEAGGVRLHYAEAGTPGGDPVVLVHGWPQHWYAWRRVIPLLAGEFRIIAPDLRGFGWSDAPRSSYAKTEFGHDVAELLRVLDLRDVRLVGHDWGGLAAFLAALEAPDRLRSVMGVCITHPWAKGRPSLTGAAVALAYQPLIAAPFVGPAAQRFTPFVDAILKIAGGDRIWSAEERRAFTERFRDPARAEAASRVYRTFLRHELGRGLGVAGRRLEVPGRLLLGSADPLVTEQLNQPVPAEIELEVVRGGHFLPEENPEAVAERVRGG
jgi:pimeloyl-ACP methyl ester carboxylesterase